MRNEHSYWNGTGKYQALYEQLNELIPASGEVENPSKNVKLERLRNAANCYYDLFNNGLCNRASQFAKIFGFSGRGISARRYPDHECARVDEVMDTIILEAALEQGMAEIVPKAPKHD